MDYCEICKNKYDDHVCNSCFSDSKGSVPSMYLPKETEKQKDTVNHPAHYETGKFECIEVMKEVFGAESVKAFCLLNAFKYIYRCKRKDNKNEDIKKANWYLNKYLELESE